MGDKHKKKMDIANTTRCYRQSKRFDLFSGQWEAKRFENHRKRVENIAPRIDAHAPKSTALQHVKVCIKCKYVVLLKMMGRSKSPRALSICLRLVIHVIFEKYARVAEVSHL